MRLWVLNIIVLNFIAFIASDVKPPAFGPFGPFSRLHFAELAGESAANYGDEIPENAVTR